MKELKTLLSILNKKEKTKFSFILLASILFAVIEIVGISSIVPFLAAASNPNLIQSNKYFLALYRYFSFDNNVDFITFLGLFVIVALFLRGIFNLLFLRFSTYFSSFITGKVQNRLLARYLKLDYLVYKKSSRSLLAKNIMIEANNLSQILIAIFNIFSEIVVIGIIIIGLFFVNKIVTFYTLLAAGICFIIMTKAMKKIVFKIGKARVEKIGLMQHLTDEILANVKSIRLTKSFDIFMSMFKSANSSHKNIISQFIISSQFPKYFLETIGLSSVIAIMIFLINTSDTKTALLTMGVLGVAFYRILPSLNKLITNFNQIRFYKNSLTLIEKELNSPEEVIGYEKLDFLKDIQFRSLSFSYQNNEEVLSKVDLTILKGQAVGIIGASGAGKSTLTNLLMGFFLPTHGTLEIDDISLKRENIGTFRHMIGYIPQDITLIDSSIAENVTMGRESNEQRIIECLKTAQLWDFANTREGLLTQTGPNGSLLSGGQKQRVLIARALYNDPEIIIMDEATSSLDQETEAEIMSEIYRVSQERTLIIIAHKKSILSQCDKIFEVKDRQITAVR